MHPDLLRLLACGTVSLLFGIVVGRPFLGLAAGLLLFILWQHRALTTLLDSLRDGSVDRVPDQPGAINGLAREFEALRSHNRQREQLLHAALDRFREAATALPDAVVVMNREGQIEWSNQRAAEYLGINWPQDRGQPVSNLVRDPGLVAHLRRLRGNTSSDVMDIASPELEGTRLEVRLSTYGDGHALLVARDMTEFHRLNKMRRDFIANASHELRTPLTVIYGYLEGIEGDPDSCPPEWRPRIAQMREQAVRMQRLIDDLLRLSTLESAVDEGLEEEVDVPEMLRRIVSEATALVDGRDREIRLEAEPGLLLKGSSADLYSAFSNIVFNAVEHTPAAGTIQIRWFKDGSGPRLEVRDSGDGIAPEHIARLTERFYRVDTARSRSKGGTGLGLAIVKHALARHGGNLEIRSSPGHGSRFICHFPAGRAAVRMPASA